jgi:CheY-like chemotaxis protein
MRSIDNKTVLIADADPYVREMVGRFVTDAGYTADFADNGYDALDNARKSPPMAIFADILLPRLDGLALCRLLKGEQNTKHVVTVIVFSVLSAEERSKKAGADAFLQKPLEKEDVLRTLEIAITKEPN